MDGMQSTSRVSPPFMQFFSFFFFTGLPSPHPSTLRRGISCIAAFVAVSNLNLAVANTLMFTMPLWTAIFAWLFARKAWDR